MKKIILLLPFFLTVFSGFSQNRIVDSLELLLLTNSSNEEKVLIHFQLYNVQKENSDIAFQHLKLAEKLIERNTADSIKVDLFNYKGNHYLFQGKYDSVFYYVNKGLTIDRVKFPKRAIDLYSLKGLAFYYKGDYNSAVEAHLTAAKVSDSLKIDDGVAKVYNNIGITYIKLKNWTKAEEYMNKSLKICKQFDIKRGISYTLGNLGIIYKNQKKYDAAIKMYEESILVSETLNDQRAISRTYNSIGTLYEVQGKYDEALENYLNNLKIAENLNDKQLISVSHINIGDLYTKQKKFKKASASLEKGLSISNKIGALNNIKEAHFGLAKMFEVQGDYRKSLEQRKKYELLNDSIMSTEHLSAVSEIETKYQTEKKDKEIAQQKLTLTTQDNELQKKKTQYSIMTGITIFLLVSSFLGWFVYQQRQKRKNQEILTLKKEQEVKTLESLMEGEEKERLRIAKELHDGVNGDLSAIKYKLTSMLEYNTALVNDVVAMIDKSSEQVRAISHNLVPPSLEKFNLIEALEDYCTTMNDVHEPKVTYRHIGEEILISKNSEINIYRIVQELVSNSVKHAKAAKITVQSSYRDNNIQITVEDDGIGFEHDTIVSNGIGLTNIASRISYLRATKDLVSNTKGTSYTIEIDTEKLNDH